MCNSTNTSQEKVCDRNFLTREALILYTEQFAREGVATKEEKNSMMTSRKQFEQSMPWQPSAAMFAIVCSLVQTSSATDYRGGRLGKETPINRRHIKQ
jgi:hypothetical protein